ncbi:peptidase [Micromonospora sp. NPDC049679]|uniref:peptidase n=1 Tax=Micromonospora sp. NPDC049679 TaxID=3155920 RepID=UPI0034068D77
MGTSVIRRAAAVMTGVSLALLPVGAATADPASPTPSPGAVTVTKAGASFLTATSVAAGVPVKLTGSTGDYLYWSFTASAGEVNDVAASVTLPSRHTGSTWTIDVFDGLRRRQACTAGSQSPTVTGAQTTASLGCTLRRVRPWAEPWSGDPLPGTYYVRLSVVDLPEQDLGLPIQVEMMISATADGDGQPEDGDLKAPLVPTVASGTVLAADASPPGVEQEDEQGWFPDFSSRWIWTAAGGILAAVGGVVGFGLTRRPRRGTA